MRDILPRSVETAGTQTRTVNCLLAGWLAWSQLASRKPVLPAVPLSDKTPISIAISHKIVEAMITGLSQL